MHRHKGGTTDGDDVRGWARGTPCRMELRSLDSCRGAGCRGRHLRQIPQSAMHSFLRQHKNARACAGAAPPPPPPPAGPCPPPPLAALAAAPWAAGAPPAGTMPVIRCGAEVGGSGGALPQSRAGRDSYLEEPPSSGRSCDHAPTRATPGELLIWSGEGDMCQELFCPCDLRSKC